MQSDSERVEDCQDPSNSDSIKAFASQEQTFWGMILKRTLLRSCKHSFQKWSL